MFQQVSDFRDESDALNDLISPLADEDYELKTQFKDWTINEVIRHLHLWNQAADLSLNDQQALLKFFARARAAEVEGRMRDFERVCLDGLCGCKLRDKWHEFYRRMCQRFSDVDPKARVKWVGPEMSVRSSITARQMETWAHGQEIYDALGIERINSDRIKNIAVLGVNTFGWTFANRGFEVPQDVPYVRLMAPLGGFWEWYTPSDKNRVEGNATEFCQVVTQVRNISDTSLAVVGETAEKWMSIAQCFAGPPEDPPLPGTRFRVLRKSNGAIS